MTTTKNTRFVTCIVAVFIFSIITGSHVLADGASLRIDNLSPIGAINVNASTTVTFYAAANGFVDPTFTLSDSFSGSGATMGIIDTFGYFSWTPSVYDAGRHTITVTASDKLNHAASSTVSVLVASNNVFITNLSPGPTVMLFRPVTFTIVSPGFTSPNYAIYQSYTTGSPTSSNIDSNGLFSWTPKYDDLGTRTFTISVTDVYGHSARTNVTLSVINPSVSIQSLKPSPTVGVGSHITFQANAPAFINPVFSVNDLFNGTSTITSSAINATGSFAWTASTSDIGTHTIVVTASDAYTNTASTTTTILVTPASVTAIPITPPIAVLSQTSAATTSTVPQINTATKYLFISSLAIGSHGSAVLELQKRLTALGFYSGPLTNYFGSMTSAGVKKFQKAHGISSIGTVGPVTRAALNN